MKQLSISDYSIAQLAHRLVSETARRQNFIDAYVNHVIRPRTIDEFTLGIQAFLRLYVFQCRVAKQWDEIDAKEAVNIAKLARSILGWETVKPVEPFLGLLLTEKPSVVFEGVTDEEATGLRTFHPAWFVQYCFNLFGRSETLEMLEANNDPPPTYVRLNTIKAEEQEILDRLAQEGVTVKKVEPLENVYKVVSTKPAVPQTLSFRGGFLFVQDKASCFAVEASNPAPETTVLDVCAAPGAKTGFIAQLMHNRGKLISIDYSKRRMSTWRNQTQKMDAQVADPVIADARKPLPLNVEADLVILDPPCTSTGTFGKLPSAKWRLTPESILKMAGFQWQMIDTCSAYVKSRGALVYSTCSITVEENEMLVERFLKWHPEFTLSEITPKLGLPGLRGLVECQRLYPHVHECNGSFIAKLTKE